MISCIIKLFCGEVGGTVENIIYRHIFLYIIDVILLFLTLPPGVYRDRCY